MAIYESAEYRGKLWCAYEIKNADGTYDEEYRLKMRMESQNLAFTCPECGEKMMLCAGPLVEPYFRHYSDVDCPRSFLNGNGKNMVARRILFQMLRRSFPEAVIEPNGKIVMEEEAISYSVDFLVTLPNAEQLAIFYLSKEMKLAEWEDCHMILQSIGITDVWFLSKYYFYTRKKTTFEYLISKYFPEMYYLKQNTNEIEIKEDITLLGGSEKHLQFKQSIMDFYLLEDGTEDSEYIDYRQKHIASWCAAIGQAEREEIYGIHEVTVKHLLNEQNEINIYRGCQNGCEQCVVCQQKESTKYPFTEPQAIINAPELLEMELRKRKKPCMIQLGMQGDPYQPMEEDYRVTRKCLELIEAYYYGVTIQTKSMGILRDLDVLVGIHEKAKCVVNIPILLGDDEACEELEPNVPTNSRRLELLRVLREKGIICIVSIVSGKEEKKENTLAIDNRTSMIDNMMSIIKYCGELGVYGVQFCEMNFADQNELVKNADDSKQKRLQQVQEQCNEYDIEMNPDKIFEMMNHYHSKLDGEQMTLF